MNKSKKLTIGLYALSIFLILGISYAYFSLNIIGNEDAKLSVISAGTLELTYTDGSDEIRLENAVPGTSFQKEITVKNTGSLNTSYNLVWNELHNTFINNEILVLAEFDILNSEGEVLISNRTLEPTFANKNIIGKNIPIESGMTYKYTFTITFVETGENQNYNQGAEFSGKISITESSTVYCTYNGELTQGAEFINGKYTYRYKQQIQMEQSLRWSNIEEDGWGVTLTDRNSTEPISGNVCTYINDIPVVSMSHMFYGSKAITIDVSNFDTSNITSMYGMFYNSQATTIKGLNNFDTSNVIAMDSMFENSKATTLDLSSFDTSNVLRMNGMFLSSKVTSLDLSNFDTKNTEGMTYMFAGLSVDTLDLSNFDTSSAVSFEGMFRYFQVTSLNLSNFDTKNVTDTSYMFSNAKINTLNLSNFDTSNVTNMKYMFQNFQIETLDISNFDTSNVVTMEGMFIDSSNIKTIYVSDKFNLNSLENNSYIFKNCTSLVGGAGTVYDSTKIDKTYARIDGGTSNPGYFTAK